MDNDDIDKKIKSWKLQAKKAGRTLTDADIEEKFAAYRDDIKNKRYLPDGISEDKFVEIVERISLASCYKFQFGTHNVEDLKQLSYVIAIEHILAGKFKPRGTKPMEVQLANFLRVWIFNRLNNYRRDKCCRYPNPGGKNQIKFNLQYALPIYSMEMSESEIFARPSDGENQIDTNEIMEKIRAKLSKKMLKLYYNYIEGEVLLPEEETKLFKRIRKILGDDFSL